MALHMPGSTRFLGDQVSGDKRTSEVFVDSYSSKPVVGTSFFGAAGGMFVLFDQSGWWECLLY